MVEEQLSASDGFVSAKDGKLKSEDYAHALKVNFRGLTIHCFAAAIIAVRLSLYVLVTTRHKYHYNCSGANTPRHDHFSSVSPGHKSHGGKFIRNSSTAIE